jgi:hypothetical protein
MQTKPFSQKYFKVFIVAFSLVLIGVSCLPVAPASTPIPTVVVLQQIITKVVTQIVYVPVTVTPTPTLYITDTPGPTDTATPPDTDTPTAVTTPPTATITPQPPTVSLLVRTECLFGPDPVYIGKYDILANSTQVAIGRNTDTSWLYVQGSDHANPCWVKAALVKLVTGNFTDPPVITPLLTPYTTLYPPPPAVSTTRTGNNVTIFWLPVDMPQDVYNGYLIEAWVCQGGQLVFVPNNYIPTFADNAAKVAQKNAVMAIIVTDEPGCSAPSSARIYTSITTAYSSPKNVPWPAAPTPTVKETPTP